MKKDTILKSVILLFLFVSLVVINNILNDPHAILHNPHENGGWRTPNLHFLKLKHIINEPRKKIILTGTSRVNYIHFSDWIPSDQFYNMGAPRKTFAEILYDLVALKKYDKLPENIFIGIDEGSFRLSTAENRKLKLKLPYPVTFLGYLDFFQKYFLTKDASNFEFIQKWNYKKPIIQYFDIQTTGETRMPLMDDLADKDPANWVGDIKFNLPMLLTDNHLSKTIDEFIELFQFLKNNEIKYQFFFNPIHKSNWIGEKSNELFEFKRHISAVTSYLDFSSPNTEVSNNNFFWYDPAHFRTNVGSIMAYELLSRSQFLANEKMKTEKKAAELFKIKMDYQDVSYSNQEEVLNYQKTELNKILPH